MIFRKGALALSICGALSASGVWAAEMTHTVKAGESVYQIVQQAYPGKSKADVAQTVTAVVKANPDAFVKGNPDLLVAGSTLTLPDGVGTLPAEAKATPPLKVLSVAQAMPAAPVMNTVETVRSDPVVPVVVGGAEPVKPPASEKAETPEESGVRFVTRKGSGKSEVVRSAPPVPAVPLSVAPLNAVQKSIEAAQAAGGIPMDPVLRDVNLPALKKDDPTTRPWVLHTRNGVNEIVKLSGNMINRIATPFRRPLLIDPTDSVSKIIGGDVYYTPSGNKPIGLFVVDSENTAQTISLTVIPTANIPGQNLIVKLEDLRAAGDLAPHAGPVGKMPDAPNDYTNYVRNLMTQAVRGTIPGFTIVPLDGGVARMGEIEIIPDLVFAGTVVDIYRYKLVNRGMQTMDLSEPAFYREGVKAVSFFPRLALEAGGSGYAFLLADKPKSMGGR